MSKLEGVFDPIVFGPLPTLVPIFFHSINLTFDTNFVNIKKKLFSFLFLKKNSLF